MKQRALLDSHSVFFSTPGRPYSTLYLSWVTFFWVLSQSMHHRYSERSVEFRPAVSTTWAFCWMFITSSLFWGRWRPLPASLSPSHLHHLSQISIIYLICLVCRIRHCHRLSQITTLFHLTTFPSRGYSVNVSISKSIRTGYGQHRTFISLLEDRLQRTICPTARAMLAILGPETDKKRLWCKILSGGYERSSCVIHDGWYIIALTAWGL